MLSSKAESKLIANSGRTPPPLSPGSAVARILLPTATSGWVGEGVLPTAKIVPRSRKLFQGSPAPGAAPGRFSEKHALVASAQSPLVTPVRGVCFRAVPPPRERG